ncbi:MAG: MFS transporter, partial [Sarcina sp.]
FFIFYAIGMLIWGPLSDKHGRKPILAIGMILYAIASIFCAFSFNIYMLIFFRIIQAIGSAAAVAVATAMLKDVYEGKELGSKLAIVQSISMMSPIISPIIGAFILRYTSWHGIFVILTIVSVIAIIGTLFLKETLKERHEGNIVEVFSTLVTVSKNKIFLLVVITFALTLLPLLAYVTISSYIYINGFGISEQAYGYFFAIGGIFLVLGPLLYIRLSKIFRWQTLVKVCFIVLIICGVFLIGIGWKSKYLFLACMIFALFFGNMLYPIGVNAALSQQDEHIGAASSMVNFINTMFESIGMIVITLNCGNKVVMLGAMYVILAVAALLLWFRCKKVMKH